MAKGSLAFGVLKSLPVNLLILFRLWGGTFFRKSRFLLLYFKKENREKIPAAENFLKMSKNSLKGKNSSDSDYYIFS
ncbi:hypothetical protein DRQ07_09535 [candidate division KSB1 bacterium]|nr:MAG: hypothetical protein DRQ07_09535 [candidate division KSB1 bacterium]